MITKEIREAGDCTWRVHNTIGAVGGRLEVDQNGHLIGLGPFVEPRNDVGASAHIIHLKGRGRLSRDGGDGHILTSNIDHIAVGVP